MKKLVLLLILQLCILGCVVHADSTSKAGTKHLKNRFPNPPKDFILTDEFRNAFRSDRSVVVELTTRIEANPEILKGPLPSLRDMKVLGTLFGDYPSMYLKFMREVDSSNILRNNLKIDFKSLAMNPQFEDRVLYKMFKDDKKMMNFMKNYKETSSVPAIDLDKYFESLKNQGVSTTGKIDTAGHIGGTEAKPSLPNGFPIPAGGELPKPSPNIMISLDFIQDYTFEMVDYITILGTKHVVPPLHDFKVLKQFYNDGNQMLRRVLYVYLAHSDLLKLTFEDLQRSGHVSNQNVIKKWNELAMEDPEKLKLMSTYKSSLPRGTKPITVESFISGLEKKVNAGYSKISGATKSRWLLGVAGVVALVAVVGGGIAYLRNKQ